MQTNPVANGVVIPPVRGWLRFEAAAILALSVGSYVYADYSWFVFAALVLAPDLSLLGYLAGVRAGAICYNVAHSYAAPAILLGAMLLSDGAYHIPLIWTAHIAIDRLLGYGLKYPTAFHDTHLGRIGRGQRRV